MTESQAIQLVEMMRDYWPTWVFKGEELRFWIHKLETYDFVRAKSAINNFYMSYEKQGRPPAGKIIKALQGTRQKGEGASANEPVLLYEIVKGEQDRGFRFFSKGGPIDDHDFLERGSEYLRQQFNELYGGEHYVVRHWMPENLPF